jgi:O-antigen/teichoic acid export membrane protein
LVLAIVLVRLLAPSEWNTVAHLLTIHLAVVMLGSLNLQHGILFFLPRVGRHRSRALVAQTAGVIAIVGVLVAIALGIAGGRLHGGTLDAGRWLPWLGLAVALELPTVCAPTAFIAADRIRAAACWDLLTTVVLLTAVVVPTVTGLGVAGVVGGIVFSAAVRAVAFAVVLMTCFDGPLAGLPPGTLASQIHYGLPLGLTIGASVLNRSVDKWLVALWHPSDVGVYAVAAQEIPLLAVLPYAAGAAMAAAVAESFHTGDKRSAHRAWLTQTATMSMVVVPVSMGLILVAPELMSIVFTDEMSAGVLPFRIFTAITLHRVAEYGLVLRAAGHTSDLLRAAVVLLASNVVLAGIGAATWGMAGASMGTLAANMIAWWFVLTRLAVVFGTTTAKTFPWQVWGRSLAISVGAAMLASVFADVVGAESPITRLAIVSGAFALAVVAAGRVSGLARLATTAVHPVGDAIPVGSARAGRS